MHPDLERLARVDALDRERRKARKTLDDLAQRHTAAREAVEAGERAVQQAEAAVAEARDEERALVRREREYQQRRTSALRVLEAGTGDPDSAQRQLDQCEQILDQTETAQLELMERQDTLARSLADARAQAQAAQAALQQADQEIPPLTQEAEGRLDTLTRQRDAELAQLDAHLRERYHMLVSRRGTAVAEIEGGACKACRMVVQTQHLADIKRGLIVPCRGCNRWLVSPE